MVDLNNEINLDENSSDYYSILNARKNANADEIKAAYYRMCVIYHPDKHQDPKNKKIAVDIFNKLHEAYDVLSTPNKRLIYDLYGHKGLQASWEIIERVRTPKEIREEYERLQHDAERRRMEQVTNPNGSTTIMINASDIFNAGPNDPFYQDDSSGLPNIELRGMRMNQSIEVPITTSNTAVISGFIGNENGIGTGRMGCIFRKIFSHNAYGELELGAGDGAHAQLKASRNIGSKSSAIVSINSSLWQSQLNAGLQAMVSRQLSKHATGQLTWTGGSASSMASAFSYNTERFNFSARLQLHPRQPLGVVAYTHKFGDSTKSKLRLRYGMMGLHFTYGCEHQINTLSRVGAYINVEQSGVTLEIRVRRHTQNYNLSIFLSDHISPPAIFYGTVTPIILYFTIKALVIAPLARQMKEKNLKENREKFAEYIAERKKKAEEAVALMMNTYERVVTTEQQRHGLVITEAWYGRLDCNFVPDVLCTYVVNVVVPVQCSVRDSKLILTDSTKSGLNGFYDPCPGEDKLLRIVYEFRDSVHEAVFSDNENVRIPKQSHRISSKVS